MKKVLKGIYWKVIVIVKGFQKGFKSYIGIQTLMYGVIKVIAAILWIARLPQVSSRLHENMCSLINLVILYCMKSGV